MTCHTQCYQLLTDNSVDGDPMIKVFITVLPNLEMTLQTDVALAAVSG